MQEDTSTPTDAQFLISFQFQKLILPFSLCEQEFQANTFEEMAELSKKHGAEMFQTGDKAHLLAMNNMKHLMQDPKAMHKWFDEKRKEFDSLPDL